MMQRRTLLLLGGAAAGTLAAGALLGPRGVERTELPAATGNLAFPGLAQRLGDARALELRKNDATLEIRREGERWVLPEKGGYPVRGERVREVLVGLTELRLAEARTSDPAQLGRLGLDDPRTPGSTAVLLRVLGANDAVLASLLVGTRRVRTQGNLPESVYVRRPDETQAWLAEGRVAVDADPQLWVDREIGSLPGERLRGVAVQRAGEPELVLGRGGEPEAKLRVITPANARTEDEVALDEIARAFEFLTFLDVRRAAQVPGTALGEARFTFTDNLAVVVAPNKDGETLWVRLRAEGDAEAQRLNARWDGWAYQLGAWKEKAFVPRLSDLRGPEPEPDAAPAPAQAQQQPAQQQSTPQQQPARGRPRR